MPHQLANAHFKPWVLFGSTGVTGRLILEGALKRGHRPSLVGRDLATLNKLASPAGLKVARATLDSFDSLKQALDGQSLVLNVAGPFKDTAEPIIKAAMAVGADYIDLNGELAVLQQLINMDEAAKAKGIVLVGSAGFGVAATDCIAAQVSHRLGGAEWLKLAVAADTAFNSPAVAASVLSVLALGGFEIAGGILQKRRLARCRWNETRPDGSKLAFASAPLAELAATFHATGAMQIVAGVPMPQTQAMALSGIAPLLPFLIKVPIIRRRMVVASGHASEGGSGYTSRVWVEGGKGRRRACARLEAGEGYALSASIAILATESLLEQRPAPGAYTPATAFGADLIMRVPGVHLTQNEN